MIVYKLPEFNSVLKYTNKQSEMCWMASLQPMNNVILDQTWNELKTDV